MTKRQVSEMAREASLGVQVPDFLIPVFERFAVLVRAEVLAQPEQNLNCKSVQARLAAAWGYVKAEPEQKRPQNCGTGYCSCVECVMEQEPVAWMYDWLCDGNLITGWIAHNESEIPKTVASNVRPLYTTPPQRKPLTNEEILADDTLRYYFGQNGGAGPVSKQGRKVVDAIEAAHGIKGEA